MSKRLCEITYEMLFQQKFIFLGGLDLKGFFLKKIKLFKMITGNHNMVNQVINVQFNE